MFGIKYDSWNDKMPWAEYIDWCRLWIKEIKRTLKPDGRFAINVLIDSCDRDNSRDWRSPQVEFYNLLKSEGLNIMGQAFWADTTKSAGLTSWLNVQKLYFWNPYEVILVGWNESQTRNTSGVVTASKKDWHHATRGIWKIHPETKGLTQANFPVELPKLCIELLTFQDDLVLDPFMGSGTTAVAAKQTNRHYIGFEISKEYSEIARARVAGVQPGERKDLLKKILGIKKKKGPTNTVEKYME